MPERKSDAFRTCRHVRYIGARVEARGGLNAIMGRLCEGVTVSARGVDALPTMPPLATPVAAAQPLSTEMSDRERLDMQWQHIRRDGPTRVWVQGQNGYAVSPGAALRDYGVRPDFVFVRRDGWSLAVPHTDTGTTLALVRDMYRHNWIGVGRVGATRATPFEEWLNPPAVLPPDCACDVCRKLLRAQPSPAPAIRPTSVPVADEDDDWIGGGRALIISD